MLAIARLVQRHPGRDREEYVQARARERIRGAGAFPPWRGDAEAWASSAFERARAAGLLRVDAEGRCWPAASGGGATIADAVS
jgi:hypothetical protein